MRLRKWLLALLCLTGQLVHSEVMGVNRIPFHTSRNHPGMHRTGVNPQDFYGLQNGRCITFMGNDMEERITVVVMQGDTICMKSDVMMGETLFFKSDFPEGGYTLVVTYQGKLLYGTLII